MLYLSVEFVGHGMPGSDIVSIAILEDIWIYGFWPSHMISGEKFVIPSRVPLDHVWNSWLTAL
jgi:hypothetical protein